MSDTHKEYAGNGYYVTAQYCEVCNLWLGYNYPTDTCDDCQGED